MVHLHLHLSPLSYVQPTPTKHSVTSQSNKSRLSNSCHCHWCSTSIVVKASFGLCWNRLLLILIKVLVFEVVRRRNCGCLVIDFVFEAVNKNTFKPNFHIFVLIYYFLTIDPYSPDLTFVIFGIETIVITVIYYCYHNVLTWHPPGDRPTAKSN